MNLHRRVEKLEGQVCIGRERLVVLVTFYAPGERAPGHRTPRRLDIRRIRHRDQEWYRLESESEEAFIERAKAETRDRRPGGVRNLVCYPDWNV